MRRHEARRAARSASGSCWGACSARWRSGSRRRRRARPGIGATSASTGCSATPTSFRCSGPSSWRAAACRSSTPARESRAATATSTPCSRCTSMRVAAWVSGGTGYAAFFYANAILLTAVAPWPRRVPVAARGPPRALVRARTDAAGLRHRELGPDRGRVRRRGALVAFANRRDGLAGVLLGLGAAAKFYPALLVIPLFAAAAARPRARPGGSASGGRRRRRGSW